MSVPAPVAGRVIRPDTPSPVTQVAGLRGFTATWGDRTSMRMRAGTEQFRAPYVISYNATLAPKVEQNPQKEKEEGKEKKAPAAAGGDGQVAGEEKGSPWSLTVLCVPTRPGWSRLILFQGKDTGVSEGRGTLDVVAAAAGGVATTTSGGPPEPQRPRAPSLLGLIFKLLPPAVMHLFSNRFLDSDLAFLHMQEHTLSRRGALTGSRDTLPLYYTPAQPDRATAAMRSWLGEFARPPRPLPPPELDRARLFDRYSQHTSNCRHCRKALADLAKMRSAAWGGLTLAVCMAVVAPVVGAVVAVAAVAVLRGVAAIEPAFVKGDFEHWKNK